MVWQNRATRPWRTIPMWPHGVQATGDERTERTSVDRFVSIHARSIALRAVSRQEGHAHATFKKAPRRHLGRTRST